MRHAMHRDEQRHRSNPPHYCPAPSAGDGQKCVPLTHLCAGTSGLPCVPFDSPSPITHDPPLPPPRHTGAEVGKGERSPLEQRDHNRRGSRWALAHPAVVALERMQLGQVRGARGSLNSRGCRGGGGVTAGVEAHLIPQLHRGESR